jgi:hypothetical protein
MEAIAVCVCRSSSTKVLVCVLILKAGRVPGFRVFSHPPQSLKRKGFISFWFSSTFRVDRKRQSEGGALRRLGSRISPLREKRKSR